MKKFGPTLGLIALFGLLVGYVMLPTSCQLSPDQQKRLQSISVPAASILSNVAVQKGWIEPGDKVVIQRGVAVVTSADEPEAKLFQLAEIGLDQALQKGLITKDDTIKVDSDTEVTITSPPLTSVPPSHQAPGPSTPILIKPESPPPDEGPVNPFLPVPQL